MGFLRSTTGAAASAVIAVLLAACGAPSHGSFLSTGGSGATGGGGGAAGGLNVSLGASSSGPPPGDAGGLCGNQILPLSTNPPIVYFVLDISGSMSTIALGNSTRFELVQAAVLEQVQRPGFLIKAGAAAFPLNPTDTNACTIGGEIVPPAVNAYAAFEAAINDLVPNGGTPTSATLTALTPHLQALYASSGTTIVVLATDGGPNCNAVAACPITDCTVNIEDACVADQMCCATNQNCCVPSIADPRAAEDCLDRDATIAAVKALATAGIPVYIIGIPGSQYYSDVLEAMAVAGGAPLFASPFYYQVQDLSTLGSVLATIAGGVVPCTFTLNQAPPDPTQTNVYFDTQVVPFDADAGWSWASPVEVSLNGTACTTLKSGAVSDVQVVSGCPTQVAR